MIQSHQQNDVIQITNLEKSPLFRLAASGVGVLFLTLISLLIQFVKPSAFSQELYYWAGLTLTTPIFYIAFLSFFQSFYRNKRFRLSIDMPLIMTLSLSYFYSLSSTIFYSDDQYAYFDSILVVLFIVFIFYLCTISG